MNHASKVALPIETIARDAPPHFDNISRDDVQRIAHLALLLAQNDARKTDPAALGRHMTPYLQLPETEREAMGGWVIRVLQALSMLGWLAPP